MPASSLKLAGLAFATGLLLGFPDTGHANEPGGKNGLLRVSDDCLECPANPAFPANPRGATDPRGVANPRGVADPRGAADPRGVNDPRGRADNRGPADHRGREPSRHGHAGRRLWVSVVRDIGTDGVPAQLFL